MTGWVALGLVAVVTAAVIGMYNGLVAKKNNVENAFGGMDVQLKKRYDLIPNLVATVKQFMEHEKNLLVEVTALRARAATGGLSLDERVNLDNQVSRALHGIMVAVENYPDIKSNQNFLQLQSSLNEIEEQISTARRVYNAAVTDYNNSVEQFPSNSIAALMKYQRKPVFETPEAQRENVNVAKMFKK
jgi:LemA protein